MRQEHLWYQAGERAVSLIPSDAEMVVFGAGRTVCKALEAYQTSNLQQPIVSASLGTQAAAEQLGIETVDPAELLGKKYVYIDGADQIDIYNNLIKGGLKVTPQGFSSSGNPGIEGCMFNEKKYAVGSETFMVIADENKLVPNLGSNNYPLPVEFTSGHEREVRAYLQPYSHTGQLRKKPDGDSFVTENGRNILDFNFDGSRFNLPELENILEDFPYVLATGLFAVRKPEIVIIASSIGLTVRR